MKSLNHRFGTDACEQSVLSTGNEFTLPGHREKCHQEDRQPLGGAPLCPAVQRLEYGRSRKEMVGMAKQFLQCRCGCQQHAASRSYKGAAKWKQEEHWPQEYVREEHGQKIPSYEMMRPKSKPEVSQKPTDKMDLFDIPAAGDYAKGIQKILNSFLKAEARTRKFEQAREETDAKWEEFQRSLKESCLKERSRHNHTVVRLNLELEEQHKIKDEAFQEMKAAIAEPH